MLTAHQHTQLRRLRWTGFVVVGVAYMLSFFHRYAPATLSSDLQLAFQANGVSLGGLAATYFYVYMVMQIPTGILVDTVGPRHVVAMGGVIAATGSWIFGMADTLSTAITGRLLIGLGVSVTFIALLKLNAVWFHDRHFATITGATILLGNLGALLAAAPLTWVLDHLSWREVFVMLAGFSWLMALLAWWLVRDHPGTIGLPSLRELDGQSAHPPHPGHWYTGLKIVLRNRATWPGLWVNMGMAGSLFAFGGLWAVPFLRDAHGLDRAAATDRTSFLLLGFSIGAFFVGTISDRIGQRKPVMMAGGLAYCLCWLTLLGGMTMQGAIGHFFFFVMGLCASSFTLSWSCAKEVNAHALSGMATSVVNIGAFLGTAILQPAVGWAIDQARTGATERAPAATEYQAGIAILLSFSLMGLIATGFIRETCCRSLFEPEESKNETSRQS
ncbi:MAG: MFS transporter [Magnetococcales bacterium]|nr:MFS transporter [Magnetococcales bacterium]